MIHLSERLSMVASLVTPGNSVADIGCDHAYTSIYLVQSHTAPFCIAMDVCSGPLKAAERNVSDELRGNKGLIDIRLSDGLAALEAGETDTVLISGMGGLLIIDILKAYPEKTKACRELVLSPQSDVSKVRRWIEDSGFVITDEKMCLDAGKYYVAIKASRCPVISKTDAMCASVYEDRRSTGKEATDVETDDRYEFSKILREKKDMTYLSFLEYELKECRKIKSKVEAENSEKAIKKSAEIQSKTRRLVDEINSMR